MTTPSPRALSSVAALAVLAVWLGAAAAAGPSPDPAAQAADDDADAQAGGVPAAGAWWRRPAVVRALGLTPEQTDRLEAVFRAGRGRLVDLRAEAAKARLDLEEALAREPFDEAAAQRAAERFETRRADLARARTAMLVRMRGVLRAEQFERLKSLARERTRQTLRQGSAPRGRGD